MSTYVQVDQNVYTDRSSVLDYLKGRRINVEPVADLTKQEILSELVRRVDQLLFKFKYELEQGFEKGHSVAMTETLVYRATVAKGINNTCRSIEVYVDLLNKMWPHQQTREVSYVRTKNHS